MDNEKQIKFIIEALESYHNKKRALRMQQKTFNGFLNSFAFCFDYSKLNNGEKPWFNTSSEENNFKYPFPFSIESYVTEIKRANNIIKQTFYNSNLNKFIDNNNNVYYCGEGMVLNGSFDPIFICFIKLNNRNYYDVIFRFSQSIFINDTKCVEKYFVKNLIPVIIERKNSFKPNTLKLEIVDDLNKYIIKQFKPLSKEDVDNADKFLIDNAKEYINYFDYLAHESC